MIFSALRHRDGFTLIEMVVVVGIMGILLVIGVASYGRMNDRAKVEQAAITVATQLRTWQKQAESGIGSSECPSDEVFGGLNVSLGDIGTDIDVDNQVIEARVVCDGASSETAYRTFNILSSCKECVMGLPNPLVLKPLGLGIAPATDITVDNPRMENLAYEVSLSMSGGIDVHKKSQ